MAERRISAPAGPRRDSDRQAHGDRRKSTPSGSSRRKSSSASRRGSMGRVSESASLGPFYQQSPNMDK